MMFSHLPTGMQRVGFLAQFHHPPTAEVARVQWRGNPFQSPSIFNLLGGASHLANGLYPLPIIYAYLHIYIYICAVYTYIYNYIYRYIYIYRHICYIHIPYVCLYIYNYMEYPHFYMGWNGSACPGSFHVRSWLGGAHTTSPARWKRTTRMEHAWRGFLGST